MKPLLDIKQASELIGLSVPTLYKYVFLGSIPFVKISNRVLFEEDRLSAFVDEHRREPAPVDDARIASRRGRPASVASVESPG